MLRSKARVRAAYKVVVKLSYIVRIYMEEMCVNSIFIWQLLQIRYTLYIYTDAYMYMHMDIGESYK